MKLEDLQKMWREDSKVDQERLDEEALKTAQLHSRYIDVLSVKKIQLAQLKSDFRRMRRLRWLYYRGALDRDELQTHGWEPWQLDLSKNTDIQNCLDGDEIPSRQPP